MHLRDLKSIREFAGFPILSSDDPKGNELRDARHFLDIAEAGDTFRLFELLHRREYEPRAIVQFGTEDEGEVKVYFTRMQCGDE